jgi:hypothetical protein
MNKKLKTSKLAVAITGIYLLALAVSVLIMLMTIDETAMSGIFLMVVSVPWTWPLTQLQNVMSVDSMLFNTLFLISGGLLNAVMLYKLISFIANRSKR